MAAGQKFVSPEHAAGLIADGDTLAVGGFVGLAVPELLLIALQERFERRRAPRELTLVFAAGQGDGHERGLNRLARPGLIRCAIGSHWGLVPALARMALDDLIEAYCLPLGVMSHLYRETAGRRPGLLTRVGLGTFVDPRLEGGRVNAVSRAEVVRRMELDGDEYLFYPSRPIDVAFLRGTTADAEGNITMEHEAATLDSLSIAQATKCSGGTVIVQVQRAVSHHTLPPREVRIPGIFVDAVVVAGEGDTHMQTLGEPFNPALVAAGLAPAALDGALDGTLGALDARRVVARRAALELIPGALVNIGIGIPEGIVPVARQAGLLDAIELTVEAGPIGGMPAGGLSFGASAHAQAVIDTAYQFDFYDGLGLDQAFLGLAQADAAGNVNVSRFGRRLPGAGGFINISQAARSLVFMGTFTAGGEIEVRGGRMRVLRPGHEAKFVDAVQQVTFSGDRARRTGQSVLYITERCVLALGPDGLELIEIAPGLDLERDVLAHMGFTPRIAPGLREMDPVVLSNSPLMGEQGPVAVSV